MGGDADNTSPPPTGNTSNNRTQIGGTPPPEDVTWISPGKVMVANYYSGGKAEYPLTIHNGKDNPVSLSVYYMHPNSVSEGYSMPSEEVQDWVIIADTTPVLEPKETRDILVTLAMPKDAVVVAQKWEFWVGVMDMSQAGTLKTQLATRWLVSMR